MNQLDPRLKRLLRRAHAAETPPEPMPFGYATRFLADGDTAPEGVFALGPAMFRGALLLAACLIVGGLILFAVTPQPPALAYDYSSPLLTLAKEFAP